MWVQLYQFYCSSHWFSLYFLFSISLISPLVIFHLLILKFICSPFPSFLRWKLKKLIWAHLKKKKRYFSATNFEMFYFHFYSVQSTLKLPFWILPWPKSYCEIRHLVTKYLMDSSRCVSVTDFPFNFIVVREPILYNINLSKSIEIYFMAQNMVSLGKCTQCTWKLWEFYYCWAEDSINAN